MYRPMPFQWILRLYTTTISMDWKYMYCISRIKEFSKILWTKSIGLNSNIYNRISYFNNQPHLLSHIMKQSFQFKGLENKYSQSKYQCTCVVSLWSNNQTCSDKQHYSTLKIPPSNYVHLHKIIVDSGTTMTVNDKMKCQYRK